MPEIVADPPTPSCYHLFSGAGIQEFQLLGPDPFCFVRAMRAGGSPREARGRPPGIRNPRRRVPDLASRPLSVQPCQICSTASKC